MVKRELLRGEDGAGLVEVLIAILLVSLALVAFLGALSTGVLSTATVRRRVTAENLAVSQLEEIKNADWEVIPDTGTVAGPYPTVSPVSGFSITHTVSVIRHDLQFVTVTVRQADTGDLILETEDYKTNR